MREIFAAPGVLNGALAGRRRIFKSPMPERVGETSTLQVGRDCGPAGQAASAEDIAKRSSASDKMPRLARFFVHTVS